MKRLISLIITFSLILSLITVPAIGESSREDNNITSQMAQAYLKVIEKVDGVGPYNKSNGNEMVQGLNYAELIDFDGDGQKELYIVYVEQHEEFKDVIWGFDGSEAYLIGENTYTYGSRTGISMGLKQIGNKTYLYYSTTYSYPDNTSGEQVMEEQHSFYIKEVVGKKLIPTTNWYSILKYDMDYEALLSEEHFVGENIINKESLTKEDYEENYSKYLLNDNEELLGGYGNMYLAMDNYDINNFIESLQDKLMPSNMKDTYVEKNVEKNYDEKFAIAKFLNNFSYFYHGEFDISNVDEAILAEFMRDSFSLSSLKVGEEEVDRNDEKFDEYGYVWKCKEDTVNKKAEELFGINIDFAKYLPTEYKDGYVYMYTRFDAAPLIVTKINKINPLGNNWFYLDITFFNWFRNDGEEIILNSLYEELPNDLKNDFMQRNQGHAIVKEVIEEGKISYQLIKYNNKGEILTEDQLDKYITKINPESNLSFDYSKIKDFKESKDFVSFLKDTITDLKGEKPNDRGISEIVTYIQYAIENSGTTSIKANKNNLIIDENSIKQALSNTEDIKSEFDKILKNNDITLNKNVEIILKVTGQNIDTNKGMSITFDNSAVESMGNTNGIRVLLGDNQHSIFISDEDIKNLEREIGKITVQIQKEKDKGAYTIVFVDSNGKEISQLPNPIRFSLPADSELATVFANYKGGSDNWGGQYSSATKSIEFSTRYSGEYSILEDEINISDIENLTDSQQRAIKFMVSKGYFELDGDKFNGQGLFNRYDFTTALVRMFFALDRDLETTFTDVEKSSKYYPYIASAQKDQIVKGFDDNTFRGDINISKEQVIALCGRTLVEKKGYVYPENPNEYLGFADSNTISDWSMDDISIAVQNGLIDNGGILMPQMEISRSEGAEILYKLFMLLYDTPPVAVELEDTLEVAIESEEVEIEESTGNSGVIIGSIIAILLLGGVGYYFFRKRKTD